MPNTDADPKDIEENDPSETKDAGTEAPEEPEKKIVQKEEDPIDDAPREEQPKDKHKEDALGQHAPKEDEAQEESPEPKQKALKNMAETTSEKPTDWAKRSNAKLLNGK